MKIFITCPNPKNPHGGLRVIFQWAERLNKIHKVYVHLLGGAKPRWLDLSSELEFCGFDKFTECDCVILTSPHSADFIDLILPYQKCFLFIQMDEYMFKPDDIHWFRLCKKFYQSSYPMFCISDWLIHKLEVVYHRAKGSTHYITNGIDLKQFPIVVDPPKRSNLVLIEGFEPGLNPTKDVDRIAANVGRRLIGEGYDVQAYSQGSCSRRDSVSSYYQQPDLSLLNSLYEKAYILVKASKFDCRSTAPIEAMTKGTPTVRAIGQGDDDLVGLHNCLRVGYNEEALYTATKKLLTDTSLWKRLSSTCYEYVKKNCDWDKVINKVNTIICA